MKPFNLEEALAGKPVVTRSGLKVTQVHLFECDLKFPLGAVIENGNCIFHLKKDGTWTNIPSDYDLFMAPTEKIEWVNLYSGWAGRYDSQEKADACANIRLASPRIGGKAFLIAYEE